MYYNGCFFTKNPSQAPSGKKTECIRAAAAAAAGGLLLAKAAKQLPTAKHNAPE